AYEELGDYSASIEANQKVLAFYASGYEAKNIYDLPDLSDYQMHSLALEMLFLQAAKFDAYYEQSGDQKNLVAAADAYALAAKGIDEMQQIYQNESKAIFQSSLGRAIYAWGIENTFKLYEQTQKKTYLNRAFNYLEKSHASLLYGAIQDQEAQTLATIPSTLLEKEDQLKTQIAQLKRQIYEAESVDSSATDSLAQWRFDLLNRKDELRQIVEVLEADFPLYHDLKYNLTVASLDEVQSQIPENTSIIEYFVEDSDFRAVYALVVNQENSSFHRIEMPTQIEDTLKAFIELIKSPETAETKGADLATFQQYIRQAQQLSALLIDSLPLKKNHDLVIIPDGILHYLPFENLLTQKVASTSVVNYASLPYLVKNHTIRYAYSATLLFKEQPTSKHQAIVAFAPSYEKNNNQYLATRSGFTALAHTTDEVLKIQELVGAQVFTGLDATEAQFKQQSGQSKILHLAMHAFTNKKAPSYSGLVFADDKSSTEDNTLHAYELYGMDIAAELLVLSACNTGSGKLAKGEGVMSLARAFRHAGCPNIVMSLWQADDAATAVIMQDFYKNLKNGNGTANALRQAKLNYLESSPKTFPHYWGAFVLMGADKSIGFANQSIYWWALGGLLILFVIGKLLKGGHNL
ncbi:MAG: CHAT domain-containing protein, partial [Bacteroidota bacterium]